MLSSRSKGDADMIEGLGKIDTVATSSAGTMFQMIWFIGADTPAAVEAATQRIEGDAG